MPYIEESAREAIRNGGTPLSPGELNYVLQGYVNDWIETHKLSYTSVNAAIGVLECLKLELYRRVAAPYEEIKIKANGDVFSKSLLSV